MSKENIQKKECDTNTDEENLNVKSKTYNYDYLSRNVQQKQNWFCGSSTDEIELKKDNGLNTTHNIQVQMDKSTLFVSKLEKKAENMNIQNGNAPELKVVNKMSCLGNLNSRYSETNEFENIKLRKTGLNYKDDKITTKFPIINKPKVFDEYAETDLDQPMDYTLCYSEINSDEEKKSNSSYLNKNDFLGVEESIEEKNEIMKRKGTLAKELTRNKKEMFINTSRSIKEIFNFFKDRDKKRSVENTKVPTSEGSKLIKNPEYCEQKLDKLTQSRQSGLQQLEKETVPKNEPQCSQQTPSTFSRCSSLGSLSGFEHNSINDDRSSIVSDFSRRTSGVASPSEQPDFPAQSSSSSTKLQQKSQIGCFGKKKMLFLQDKSKAIHSVSLNDNSVLQNDCNHKKNVIIKRSVFEDNLTSFKDESTPTKLYSVAASSLSSLTIDDDDDYDVVNKIILTKEKQNETEEIKVPENIEPNIKSNLLLSSTTSEKEKALSDKEEEEDLNDEENDELTDLTPFEEQVLDECIRRGIAKWTKQNINEIKSFSWDLGLTCRTTRSILANKIRINSSINVETNTERRKINFKDQVVINNNFKLKENFDNNTGLISSLKSSTSTELNKLSNFNESNYQFHQNHYYVTYEEHLLDQCIRRGMAKITKRSINDIKPFSWDANGICLTTRAMMLRGRDENIHITH